MRRPMVGGEIAASALRQPRRDDVPDGIARCRLRLPALLLPRLGRIDKSLHRPVRPAKPLNGREPHPHLAPVVVRRNVYRLDIILDLATPPVDRAPVGM